MICWASSQMPRGSGSQRYGCADSSVSTCTPLLKYGSTEHSRVLGVTSDLAHYNVAQMLDYNVPGGKLNRGMAVLDALRALKGDEVARPFSTLEE